MTAILALPAAAPAQTSDTGAQAKTFLDKNRNNWTSGINYWNVPYEDGQILHDLIVKGGFKNILEIGTSTGHSTVWLAWAAAKTGGRVTTIEIDQRRHHQKPPFESVRRAARSAAAPSTPPRGDCRCPQSKGSHQGDAPTSARCRHSPAPVCSSLCHHLSRRDGTTKCSARLFCRDPSGDELCRHPHKHRSAPCQPGRSASRRTSACRDRRRPDRRRPLCAAKRGATTG